MMGRALKLLLGTLITLVALILVIVSIAWYAPHWILTPSRVAKYGLTLNIEKPSLRERRFELELAPGCYRPESLYPGSEFCVEKGKLAFTIRFHRKTLLQVSGLNFLDFRFNSIKIPPESASDEGKPVDVRAPTWTKYLADRFVWGPIHLNVRELRIGDLMIQGGADTSTLSPTPSPDSPSLDFWARADANAFKASARGKIERRGHLVHLSKVTATYDDKPMQITFNLSGSHDLLKGVSTAEFKANWKNPIPFFASLTANAGHFIHDETGWRAKAQLNLVPDLKGKGPLGNPPALSFRASAEAKYTDTEEPTPLDIAIDLLSYDFAGIHMVSDLGIRVIPRETRTDLELKRGELQIKIPSFRKTVKTLERTAWAIPAPFAVLDGSITLSTAGFKSHPDRTDLTFDLVSNLHSFEQNIVLTALATLALTPKTLTPRDGKIAVHLKNVKFRVPDYDPIAPVPAFARDPRIIRYEAAPLPEKETPTDSKSKGLPIEITIDGDPGSITLLNRYFKPVLTAKPRLTIETNTGVMKGDFTVSAPFIIEYLNRKITVESMRIGFTPAANLTALVSMERAGYRIIAHIQQNPGKTRITLESKPPLSEEEIVSLILYGMPRSSISSEQTKSVGSAQAAISAQALGIFSFWAFASTPIESVIYDPTTQTYSAVVRLPGGLVASIGSNWEKDRQVSLSKALGRNWAVSTELIKDSEGVDRGGTLLRWRKSY